MWKDVETATPGVQKHFVQVTQVTLRKDRAMAATIPLDKETPPLDTQSIIAELEHERDRLENAIRALQNSSGGRGRKPISGKRHMSAEARRKISLAQKKRWAKQKREA